MKVLLSLLTSQAFFIVAVFAFASPQQERFLGKPVKTPNISPEIINELKDFETLIPESKIDAIVAEHFLVDGNFRKAFKYLRSNEFKLLQKHLLDVSEIIEVLDFLHMTINATIPQSNAAATDGGASSSSVNDNGLKKTTTNAATTGTGSVPSSTIPTSDRVLETKADLAYETPQLDELENAVDVSGAYTVKLPLVDIVLLGEKEVSANDDGIADHYLHNHQHPVGSFTSFVEDIIKQLPRTAYQNMIIEKCQKSAKFADFYRALRSAEFEPLVNEVMKTSNIKKIIDTLSAHDIDVKSLKPIGFEVISWGPKAN